MKPVEQMTIEECEREVKQHNPDLDTLCYTMDSADKAIRAAGWKWARSGTNSLWGAYDYASEDVPAKWVEHIGTTQLNESPALDLWRLTVKVCRAKKGRE